MGYIFSLEAITRVSKELGINNKIIYTHGAYDLFHIGHLEFLRASKEQGQILIVGVEPDEIISLYKNVNRPVIPLDQRMSIISKLNFVDFVFPIKYINDPSNKNGMHKFHTSLYKILNPNVITYGRSYGGMKTINEAKLNLKNIKFKKILHKFDKIQSTTKIVDKILNFQKN
jgi:cytidyltransferase-like protein